MSDQIASRVPYTKSVTKPTHVFIQSGEIDIRNKSIIEARRTYNNLIDTVLREFPDTRILTSTVPNNVDSALLQHKINQLNVNINHKCRCVPELSVIDCAVLQLRDHIHINKVSMENVACKIINSILYI